MNPGATAWTPRPFARPAEAGRETALTAVGVFGLALALRLAMAPQFDGLDDLGYLEAAQRVSQGRSLEDMFPLFRTRLGMAYPMGALLQAGWLSPAHFWILTTLAECVTLVSLFACGWLLTGTARVGLAAASLYAIYPLAVQQSAMYYPTAFQVAAIAAACALVAGAERVRRLRARLLLALGAGVALGLGYLVKEDVAIVVPAIALASLLTGYPRRTTALALCGGAAVVFLAECGGYWLTTGHPLFRLTASSGLGAAPQTQLQIAEIWRWDAFLRSLFLVPAQVGLIWWLVLPALWWAFVRGDVRVKWVATTFVVLMAYLQFGSGSFTSYAPLPKTPRYTALVTPLLMLVVGAWLARLYDERRHAVLAVSVAALVLAAVPSILYLQIASSERTRNTLAVLPSLHAAAPERLYTDYYGARVLRVLEPDLADVRVWYHARFDTNEIIIPGDPASDGEAFVLLDRQAAKVYTSSYEMTLPPQITDPPADWELVWSGRAYGGGTLSRALLERARAAAARLPAGHPLRERVHRNISDMIDGDEAILYRVPGTVTSEAIGAGRR